MTKINKLKEQTDAAVALGKRTVRWLASAGGQRSLAKTLRQGDVLTAALERECRVERASLHEPVTL